MMPVATLAMNQDRTWNLFALKLAGKATPEEWAELQLLIESRPEIAVHLQALTNFWHQHSKYDRERIEKAIKKIAENYAEQKVVTDPQKKMSKENAGFYGEDGEERNLLYRIISVIKKQVGFFFADIHKRTGRYKANNKTNSLTG